jgi:hypothetical protein
MSSCIDKAIRAFKFPKRRTIRKALSVAIHLEKILYPVYFQGASEGVFRVSFSGSLLKEDLKVGSQEFSAGAVDAEACQV